MEGMKGGKKRKKEWRTADICGLICISYILTFTYLFRFALYITKS